ncbi:hypothetical protein BACCIP111899_00490 [Bacillus rhizoplanae]|uniref:Uncharacterized protein n=1 Tax=Bacillus rhizoplanae TaxID=2880966 RepID=A0ABN7ZVP4_9BACI|nr:hypothetical protein [Bacillus rhizoplanae]CAG9611318.1 hypothetical protein BACCIP111899_00490 [Bacillus rhizoplanae]
MKQKNMYRLSLVQLLVFVLNLFIFSSTIRFLPWFVEDAVGWFGVLITAPLLLIIAVMMIYLQESKGYVISRTKKIIPFIASIFSICIVLLNITDLSVITALIFNLGMIIITVIFLLQDFFTLNKS